MKTWTASVLLTVAACSGAVAQPSAESAAAIAPSFGGEKIDARPSRDSTLGFTFPAEVMEVFVKGGERVRKGQPLVRAFDLEYRYQRDTQKIIAESDLDVQRAQAQLDGAQVELDSIEQIMRETPGGGSKVEHDRAKVTVLIRKVELGIAVLQQNQAKVQLAFREAQVDRFTIKAPFDGEIDQVGVDLGMVKKDGEPVLRIVNTDPLWLDVPTPTAQTLMLKLKPGDPAWVLPDLPGPARVFVGKIIELGATADPRANTRRVRVEIANPEKWPSGLWCWTRFTPPTGDWTPRIVAGDQPAGGATGADPALALRDAGDAGAKP
ncbi:MAG: efflux RND transporter periplasmic adaptor subunit [Phycisphaerales bacterium]